MAPEPPRGLFLPGQDQGPDSSSQMGWGGEGNACCFPLPREGLAMACWLWGTPHSPDWAGLPCHPLSLPPEPPSSPPASSATPRHYSQQCRQQPSMLHAHLSGLHHDPACEDRCQPVHTGTLSSGRGPWGLPKHKALFNAAPSPQPGESCSLGRGEPDSWLIIFSPKCIVCDLIHSLPPKTRGRGWFILFLCSLQS